MSAEQHAGSPAVSALSELFLYPELVPLVLEHLYRPSDLAVAARVCRAWRGYAQRMLYKDVWVRPWERAPKQKFLGLFESLKENLELCDLIRSLDIRFFPLEMQGEEREVLEHQVAKTLMRIVNLEKLVWTRDRSTTFDLWSSIFSLSKLRHLEISGRIDLGLSKSLYAELIGSMPALRDLRVMMPDGVFRSAIPDIIKALDARPQGGLHGLTLICKSNPWFSDEVLEDIAPHLVQLRRLELLGLTRITRAGVLAVLDSASGLEELIVDAPEDSRIPEAIDGHVPALRRLSISVSVRNASSVVSSFDMPRFPQSDCLQSLELTIKDKGPRLGLTVDILDRFLPEQRELTRLALLNINMSHEVMEQVVRRCPKLEELFCTTADGLDALEPIRHHPTLRIVHVNSTEFIDRPYLADLAATLPQIQEIGCLNRVYEVHKFLQGDKRVVELSRWSQPFTPVYFQVWRP